MGLPFAVKPCMNMAMQQPGTKFIQTASCLEYHRKTTAVETQNVRDASEIHCRAAQTQQDSLTSTDFRLVFCWSVLVLKWCPSLKYSKTPINNLSMEGNRFQEGGEEKKKLSLVCIISQSGSTVLQNKALKKHRAGLFISIRVISEVQTSALTAESQYKNRHQ